MPSYKGTECCPIIVLSWACVDGEKIKVLYAVDPVDGSELGWYQNQKTGTLLASRPSFVDCGEDCVSSICFQIDDLDNAFNDVGDYDNESVWPLNFVINGGTPVVIPRDASWLPTDPRTVVASAIATALTGAGYNVTAIGNVLQVETALDFTMVYSSASGKNDTISATLNGAGTDVSFDWADSGGTIGTFRLNDCAGTPLAAVTPVPLSQVEI